VSTPTRKAIRDDLVAALTGLVTTEGRVYASRVYPLSAAKLPGLVVYSESEEVQYITMGLPRTQMRVVSFAVEVYVRGTASYDDDIDTIAAEVEAALYADVERGGLAKDTQITALNFEFSGDGDQPVGVGQMTVEVQYITAEGAVTTS